MALKPIRIIISGVDQFTATFAKSMKGIDKLGKKLDGVGKKLTTGLTLPIMAAGALATVSVAKYETAMSRAGAITGATTQQMSQMEDMTNKLGTSLHSAIDVADGFQLMADSGFAVKDSLTGMPGVLQLSTMSLTTLAEAVDIADNLTEGYNRNIGEMTKINDIMAVSAQKGGVGVKLITDGLLTLSPVSSQLGLSLEEMTATIGLLGQTGINMPKGIKAIQTALGSLISPSTTAIETFQRLKIKKSDLMDSEGKLKSMSQLLNVLSASGAKSADLMDIFGVQAGPIMGKLLAKGGDALKEFSASLTGTTGTAEKIVSARERTLSGKLQKLKATGTTLAKSFGEALLPVISPLADLFGKLANKLNNLSPQTKTFIAIIGGIVAAVGPLLVALGGIMTFMAPIMAQITAAGGVLALLSNPIGWIIAGIGALVAIITYMSTHVNSKLTKTMALFFPFAGVVTWVISRWQRLLPFFKLLFLVLGAMFKTFGAILTPILTPIIDLLSFLGDLIFKTLDAALGGLEKLASLALPTWLKDKIGLLPSAQGAGGSTPTAGALRDGAVNVNNRNENKTTIVIDNKAGAKIRTQTDKGAVDLQTYSGQLLPMGG